MLGQSGACVFWGGGGRGAGGLGEGVGLCRGGVAGGFLMNVGAVGAWVCMCVCVL